jgi:hypothetical protein
MALEQNYYCLWFESFRLKSTSGHNSNIQLKLVVGQDLPKEILQECGKRSTDPFSLLTECSKKLFNDYQVGTQFLLKAKLTDREGHGLFFYNYHGWKPFEIKA